MFVGFLVFVRRSHSSWDTRFEKKSWAFMPGLNKRKKARKIVTTEYGLELGEKSSFEADVVVILGSMAMPKIGVKPEEMKNFLANMKYKKLIGVCFMSNIREVRVVPGLQFDYLMNMIIEGDLSK